MILPNAEIAEVDIRKLVDYCLNPDHPEGKHKARLFSAALSLTADDAGGLREALLQGVLTVNASVGLLDEYGVTLSTSSTASAAERRPSGAAGLSSMVQMFRG